MVISSPRFEHMSETGASSW